MIKWKYQILVLDGRNEEKLNELGDEGWELVCVTSESEERYATAYFKRQKTRPPITGKLEVARVQ